MQPNFSFFLVLTNIFSYKTDQIDLKYILFYYIVQTIDRTKFIEYYYSTLKITQNAFTVFFMYLFYITLFLSNFQTVFLIPITLTEMHLMQQRSGLFHLFDKSIMNIVTIFQNVSKKNIEYIEWNPFLSNKSSIYHLNM